MTKTQTAPALAPALPPVEEARKQGLLLLDAVRESLRASGYVKTAIDTYTDRMSGHSVRHSYANGTWTLSCGYNGHPRLEVRYSVFATMPSVDELMNAIVPPPF
jgi:hypothetical protein